MDNNSILKLIKTFLQNLEDSHLHSELAGDNSEDLHSELAGDNSE